jgi:hypothetical protein
MPRLIDLTGQRFGRLLVVRRAPSRPTHTGRVTWLCDCDCGRTATVRGTNMRAGITRSCGCLRVDVAREQELTHGEAGVRRPGNSRHKRSREYSSWCAMRARCYIPSASHFEHYGGRGITVCDRWRNSYEAFLADMGRCPPGHSLDRVDVNGRYEPGNVRWADVTQQNNNARSNHRLEFRGETKTAAQWERARGLKRGTVSRRLLLGWPVERALTESAK